MQLRAWARRTPRRYGIWKVYLVSDLFYLLDITTRGVFMPQNKVIEESDCGLTTTQRKGS